VAGQRPADLSREEAVAYDDEWVFEAQSVLFEHYQQQMVRQQGGRAVPA
jgi:hypothetical protein